MREKPEEVGKVSAEILTKTESHILGKNIFHFVNTHVKAKAKKEREKLARVMLSHAEKRSKAAAGLLAKGADHTKWSGKDLKHILNAMKTKDDHSLPQLKVDLLTLCIKWRGENSVYTVFDEAAYALVMEAENNMVIERNVDLMTTMKRKTTMRRRM